MNTFLSILAAYYMCDAAATAGTLRDLDVRQCTAFYEEVKSRAPGPQGSRSGYVRFKAWEAENAALVARMKDDARLLVDHLATLRNARQPQRTVIDDVAAAR